MVGIYGEIMENERENFHQLTGARDEVFALVLDDFSMDSHQSRGLSINAEGLLTPDTHKQRTPCAG